MENSLDSSFDRKNAIKTSVTESTTRRLQSANQTSHGAGPTLVMKAIKLTNGKNEINHKTSSLGPTDVYQQRKNILPQYKELFQALFRLPDKDVQRRVMGCINATYRSIETQTEPVYMVDRPQKQEGPEEKPNVSHIKQEPISTPNDTSNEPATSKPELPTKRKRKRKISQPQVNKESRVALAKEKQMAKMNNPQSRKPPRTEVDINEIKRPRLDSVASVASFLNYEIEDNVNFDKEKIAQNIIKGCILAKYTLENGLLPIQDSIVKNQTSNLKLQIFILKDFEGVDLNELLTDENEDLLQLAIAHNCSRDIIRMLLENGLNPNSVDDQGNTAIHLAIMNDIDQGALENLMQKIDPKMLLTLNDDGYTALHIAIRQEYFLLAECLLNIMDKLLSGKVFYDRKYDIFETDAKVVKKEFHKYYESVCQHMEENEGSIINNHILKRNLLQKTDMRSGNTALFFAIENESEHLIYFLLAHLTDPRTENLSGQDCKTFFAEFGKTLNLSLNIDGAMEKVIKLLS